VKGGFDAESGAQSEAEKLDLLNRELQVEAEKRRESEFPED
jgi:hypothetical protein